MLSRFHLIPERHGRTDERTNGRTNRRTELLYQCVHCCFYYCYIFSIVFSCSVLCKFCVCFFFLFLFKGSSKCGFFHLAVLFRFYRVLFLHHVFLSEQIKKKMMMMMMMINITLPPLYTVSTKTKAKNC